MEIGQARFQSGSLSGIAVSTSQVVYVSDTDNGRIQAFTGAGIFIDAFGDDGGCRGFPLPTDEQFCTPSGLDFDSSGDILVADRLNDRIKRHSADGTFVMKWGIRGGSDENLDAPTGLVVDDAGFVYVTEGGRIKKFTSDSTFVMWWGAGGSGPGQMQDPQGLAVDSFGHIYLVDSANDRIQKFTPDGAFVDTWGTPGTGDGMFVRPVGIAIDYEDKVYVTDCERNRIQVFTSDGGYITEWGTFGTGPGEFNCPNGIAVDALGSIYVVDAGNHRIQKFAFPVASVDATPTTWGQLKNKYQEDEGNEPWPIEEKK